MLIAGAEKGRDPTRGADDRARFTETSPPSDVLSAASLEPIGTFLRARAAFRADGPKGYVDVLGAAEREIPITSFMGLLGSAGAKLTDGDLVARDALRDYAVRCATPVELRLAEWKQTTFIMPGNLLHATSFLLHAVLGTAMKTKMLLLFDDGIEEAPELSLETLGEHLADDRKQLEAWLLKELGGITTTYGYTYDYAAVAKAITRLDPDSPLMLDLPFARKHGAAGCAASFRAGVQPEYALWRARRDHARVPLLRDDELFGRAASPTTCGSAWQTPRRASSPRCCTAWNVP